MQAKINLITIWTDEMAAMKEFYHEVLGFEIANDNGGYVEFANEGVRFALCTRVTMFPYSSAYMEKVSGQAVELAFPCASAAEVDTSYADLIAKGATSIHPPQDMPWQQRTAFFADPDGNIHELFAEL